MPRASIEITSRIAPMALALARARGLDPAVFIERHQLPRGLDWAQAGKLEVTLPADRLRALLDDLADALGLPHLGLELAASRPRGGYGVTEFLVRSVGTVRGACENLIRFSALLAPSQTFRFTETAR
ncbi:MAG: AraC family transcriptional regulator ligand-binding domain-containing protein, partial [Myxococcaceae bacterium]|nr:AraC family transcriptional regulator ligand-binding domain-containing protein [Myxococcaceae bacterium]